MKCKHCNRQITWEDQKYGFGHLQRAGYSIEVLTPIFPSHVKCAEKYIKSNKILKDTKAS